jgi:hypothetical protein
VLLCGRVTAAATFVVLSRVRGAAGGGGEGEAVVGVIDWVAAGCGEGAGGGGGGGGGVTRVAFFGFGSGFGGGGGLGSGTGAVVVAAVLAVVVVVVVVVSPVVTCCGEACPARATEDTKPSAQMPRRASVASPIGRECGGAAPAPSLIGLWRASRVLSAREEEEMTPVRNSLVSVTNVDRLRSFASRENQARKDLRAYVPWALRRSAEPAARNVFDDERGRKDRKAEGQEVEAVLFRQCRDDEEDDGEADEKCSQSESHGLFFSTTPGEHLPYV